MALSATVTGDGILVSKTATTRSILIAQDGDTIEYEETQEEEVREWVALTQAAAEGAVDTNSQSGLGSGEVASYQASEDNRVIGSYRLTKTVTSTTVEYVGVVV